MPRVLIVPGLNNSGPGHWQTEWERHLRHVRRIKVADWSRADLQAWTDAIELEIEAFAPTHIVAHSFGCLATAQVLSRIETDIREILLVAPADPAKFDIVEQLPAAALPVPGVLVGSLTDPWLSWSGAEALGKRWGLRTVNAGDAGHINVQSGHGHWSQGWLILQRMLQQQATTLNFLRDTQAPRRLDFGSQRLTMAY